MFRLWNRSTALWTGAFALASVAAWSVASGNVVRAAPSSSTGIDAVSRNNAAISTGRGGAMWTTYKGDAQRTSALNVSVRLPLNLMWRYSSDAEPGAIVGSPLVVGQGAARRVLFNAGKTLYCLDTQTGESLWKWDAASALRAPLTLMPGRSDIVLTLSTKGLAQAFRISDGSSVWEYQADSALNVAPIAIRTTRGDRIVLAPASGNLIALTTDGVLDPAWRVSLGNGAKPTTAPVASASGDRLFFATNDAMLYGIDVKAARVAFSVNLGGNATTSPVAIGNVVYATGGTTLIAARADNGTVVWRAASDNDQYSSESFTSLAAQPPLGSSNAGIIYAGTSRGSLMAFNTRDGKALWKTKLARTSLSGSPLVLANTILVGGRDGVFYGVDSAKGGLLWKYRLESDRRVLVPKRATPTPNGNSTTQPRNPFGSPFVAGSTGTTGTGASAQATPAPMVYEFRTYGTSSAPAVAGGQIYVPADNAALYAFSTTAFDAAPPSATEPIIVIPDTTNRPYDTPVTPDFPGIANKGPVSLTLQLSDAGSGVDASKASAIFDGQALPANDVKYDAASGILSLSLFKPTAEAKTLSDGIHKVDVQVTDYNGNTSVSSTSFKVDATYLSPPPRPAAGVAAPTQTAQPQWGGWRGNWDPSQRPPPWRRNRFRDGNNTS